MIERERCMEKELQELMVVEESFLKQKSRVQWLQEGDQNTNFFHRMMAAKQHKNSIISLIDLEGNRLESYDQISKEIVRFFQNLIGTVGDKVTGCPKELLKEILSVELQNEAYKELVKLVSALEVKTTMFSINGEKALGPDGYTSHFFKVAWRIVGEDVTDAILSFFQRNELHPAFNSTIVTLVPKCQNPNSIRDFRPISCCSVIYKCITKIMANRMKQFSPALINGNQSAFIPGRSITDNILMAQELVKG